DVSGLLVWPYIIASRKSGCSNITDTDSDSDSGTSIGSNSQCGNNGSGNIVVGIPQPLLLQNKQSIWHV
ncbi:unnamed protein product, partial [Ceratitis capitata]